MSGGVRTTGETCTAHAQRGIVMAFARRRAHGQGLRTGVVYASQG